MPAQKLLDGVACMALADIAGIDASQRQDDVARLCDQCDAELSHADESLAAACKVAYDGLSDPGRRKLARARRDAATASEADSEMAEG